jgi:excisionase family DNA binding protein
MTTNEYFDHIRDALRSEQANTPSGQAVARLKQPFPLGNGEKWHYEGFVSMFSAIRHALASLDDSISTGLPPFLLDPATVARLFSIPLAEFNWQGYPTDCADPSGKTAMFTVREAAVLLGCSYGEARKRLLEGRIRAVKDGRWLRTRPEWVEEYLASHMITPVDPSRAIHELPVPSRRKNHARLKPNGIGSRFLRNRAK